MRAPIPAKAVGRQWMWKNASMLRLTRAGLVLALERNGAEFSANDLPADLEHGGRGNCGTIFSSLAGDGVFSAIGFHHNGQWIPKTVKNAGGNHINVYSLGSEALARELLSRLDALAALAPVPEHFEQVEML